MDKINDLINKSPIHITTNTIILIIVAIIALYILIKAITGIIKTVALIGVCYFVLMSLQSTNIVNIPVIRDTYTEIEKYIPSREVWTETKEKVDKINKVVNDLK